jgi:hypothetical protein
MTKTILASLFVSLVVGAVAHAAPAKKFRYVGTIENASPAKPSERGYYIHFEKGVELATGKEVEKKNMFAGGLFLNFERENTVVVPTKSVSGFTIPTWQKVANPHADQQLSTLKEALTKGKKLVIETDSPAIGYEITGGLKINQDAIVKVE